MSSLEGKTIATTYKDLLQVSNNNIGIDGVIRSVEDGEGTASALSLSTDTIEIHGNILPHTNSTYDIGSADKKIRHLYLSDNSLYIGDLQFSNIDLQEVKNLRSGAFATSVQGALAESAIQPGSFSFSDLNERPTTLAGFGIVDAATAAQGDKASSAIQPGDSIPFSVIDAKPTSLAGYGIVDAATAAQGERADSALQPGDMIHVNTIHLSGGVIYGPPVMYIDPTGIGDNTGKVCIMGDLQIDGTTTTVNSTTLSVSGKTINLSEGATSASESDGAGVVVTGGDASMIYKSVPDQWSFNKSVDVHGWINAQADALSADAVINLVASNDDSYTAISRIKSISESDSNASSSLTFSTRDSANDISENMRIDSAGNVGIGTTTPLAKLTVKGGSDTSASSLEFNCQNGIVVAEAIQRDNNNSPSDLKYVAKQHIFVGSTDGNGGYGNVGIGTTNPGTALEINKEIGESSPIITLSRGGASKSRFAIANATSSILAGAVTDDLCIRTEGGNIRFGTASATKTDMSILSNGNVGIGTTSPDYKLDISTNSTTGLRLINHTTPGTNESNDPPAILFQAKGWDTDVGSRPYSARIRVNSNYSGASDRGNSHPVMNFDLETNENDPDDTLSTKMMINADGNVGIGTTSPDKKLQVAGSIRATKTVVDGEDLALDFNPGGGADHPTLNIYDKDGNDGARITANGDSWFSAKGGNVGIGTTSPDYSLHISTNSPGIKLTDTTSSTIKPSSQVWADSDTLGALFIAADSTNIGTSPFISFRIEGVSTANEKMRINSEGNVGIGTTNPIGALEVKSNSNEVVLRGTSPNGLSIIDIKKINSGDTEFSNSLYTGGTAGDFIFSNGNVGIGTTSPIHALDVFGFGKKMGITSEHADGTRIDHATLHTDLSGFGNMGIFNDVGNPRVQFKSNGVSYINGGNVGIGTASPGYPLEVKISSDDWASRIYNTGSSDSAAGLLVRTDATSETDTHAFGVYADGGYKFSVKSTGNVGIGTSSPTSKLSIHNTGTTSVDAITLNWEHLTSTSGLEQRIKWKFGDDATANASSEAAYIAAGKASSWTTGANRNSYLSFATTDGGNTVQYGGTEPNYTAVERMRISHNGNVGIGTTSPGAYTLNLAASQQEFVQKIGNNHSTSAYGMYIEFTGNHDNKTSEYIRCSTNGNTLINFKVYSDGTVFSDGSSLGSDDRIKHNEEIIVNAVETLSKITPKKYFKTTKLYDPDHDFDLDSNGNPIDENSEPVNHRVEAGVIAQEVLGVDELKFAVTPETKDEDGNVTTPYALNYNSLFTYAIAAIQEQQTIIEDLKARIETLENK